MKLNLSQYLLLFFLVLLTVALFSEKCHGQNSSRLIYKNDSLQVSVGLDSGRINVGKEFWNIRKVTPENLGWIKIGKTKIYFDKDSVVYHNLCDQCITVADWRAYEQECWNDSTEISQEMSIIDGKIVPGKKNYSHLTKPTLDGFMKYLERKTK